MFVPSVCRLSALPVLACAHLVHCCVLLDVSARVWTLFSLLLRNPCRREGLRSVEHVGIPWYLIFHDRSLRSHVLVSIGSGSAWVKSRSNGGYGESVA